MLSLIYSNLNRLAISEYSKLENSFTNSWSLSAIMNRSLHELSNATTSSGGVSNYKAFSRSSAAFTKRGYLTPVSWLVACATLSNGLKCNNTYTMALVQAKSSLSKMLSFNGSRLRSGCGLESSQSCKRGYKTMFLIILSWKPCHLVFDALMCTSTLGYFSR